jgi:EpsI family protein
VVAALWPAYAIWLDQRALPKIPALSIQSSPAWQAVSASTFTDWTPHWLGADRQFRSGFARMGQRVMLQINYYVTQRQNAELINSQNYMIPQLHPVWANVGESVRTVDIAGRSHQVRQTLLKSSYGQRLLVWQWNVIDGQPTVSELMAKR